MAEKLTIQQEQAVMNRGGQLLVSAAAGSGKTKVLVDRLMGYLTDPVNPANLDEFLIITYTNAAASELRGKIAAKLTERIAADPENRHLQKQMQRLFLTQISTVHGFCGDILREYAYMLDLSADFRIADENECQEIRDQVMTDLLDRAYQESSDNPDFRVFVDSQGLGRTDKLVPEIIGKVFDSSRCHKDPEAWLEDCLKAADVQGVSDVGKTTWGEYLMDDLFDYLDCQMRALGECVNQAQTNPDYSNVVTNLNITMQCLEAIRSASSWDEVVKNREITYKKLTFPRKNPDLDLNARIKAVRDGCKAGMERKLQAFADPSSQVLEDLTQAQSAVRGLVSLVRQFDTEYSLAKKRRHCLDFGDLEHKALDLLMGKGRSGPTSAALEIRKRFREVMVDEYQDSNGVQDSIFSVLTAHRNNGFYVGDVKQSIYQFRLADPSIFLNKYQHFVPAEDAQPGQGRKILLSDNFRSGPEVIDAVNDVFTTCMRPKVGGLVYGEGEMLREGIPHEVFPDPAVELYAIDVEKDKYPEEAAFVADKIRKMLDSGTLIRDKDKMRPVRPEDIAILMRSPNSTGIHFQKALETRGIRYVSGSSMELLKTREISVMRSLLQTILNPRMDIPLVATLASPLFGFSADLLANIRSKQKKGSFYEALMLDDSNTTKRFLLILDCLRTQARHGSLSDLMEHIFALTHADSIFAAMPSGQNKAANLQLFYQLAVDFEKGSVRDLAQFLEHLNALEKRGISGSSASTAGCVTIISIHKSKGLEYPVVFLSNLSKRFNQESLRAQILCDKKLGIGVSIADSDNRIRYPSVAKRAISVKMAAESVSEEMRVLYVAMTRARDRLIMTYAAEHLDKALKDLAYRRDFDGGELLCRDCKCMGNWVLISAISKIEAGSLHAIADRPSETSLSRFPWKIEVVSSFLEQDTFEEERPQEQVRVSAEVLKMLRDNLRYQYPHAAATQTPSKQTATGRKGRTKDEEAVQNTKEQNVSARTWRRAAFVEGGTTAVAYGNAMHSAMQHICYARCFSTEAVREEIDRMQQRGLLTQEQAQMVNPVHIANFFRSEIGALLRNGVDHVREFKFSILDDGRQYGDNLDGEQVLLQGVVDCAILEKDGITILDFKTDRVNEDNFESVLSRYRPQVEAYAQAMGRIYDLPVKGSYLYFFRMNRFVAL